MVAARQNSEDGCGPRRVPAVHTYAALRFCTAGRFRMQQRGDWTLQEGEVLLVPAGEPHRMLGASAHRSWGLAFCVPCFASADGAAQLLEPFERVRDGAAAVVHIPDGRRGYLEGLFQELDRLGAEHASPGEAQAAVRRSLLTLILAEVDGAASHARPGKGGGVVVDALRHIERHCLSPLTVNDVAAAVGRGLTYVTAALKRATGRSASQWIVGGRMAEARRLLLHSDERVDVVAERVGYAEATHFIRMFRREHGTTPAAWRNAQAARRPAGTR